LVDGDSFSGYKLEAMRLNSRCNVTVITTGGDKS
jgi:hypothetical protein